MSRSPSVSKREPGCPISGVHDLRHSHATLLMAQGVSAKIVQERLGHSKIGITLDTYSHVMPTMQREAADQLDVTLAAATATAAKGPKAASS